MSSLDLRRHRVTAKQGFDKIINDNVHKKFGSLSFEWSDVEFRKLVLNKIDDFKTLDVTVFKFSIAVSILPREGRGSFINPACILLCNYEPFFIQWLLSLQNVEFKRFMFTLYAYMKSRKFDPRQQGARTSDVKVDASSFQLNINDIFSPDVLNFVLTKGHEIGNLDAKRVPHRIVKKGLSMEKFMEPYQSLDRELESECFIHSYMNKIPGFMFNDDCWLLNFVMDAQEKESDAFSASGSSFYTGLPVQLKCIKSAFGMIEKNQRLSISMDRMRLILARDPALRSVASPEELISLLREHGVYNATQSSLGIYLLRCTGMENSVAFEFISAFVDSAYGAYPGATCGALTDDFSSTLKILNIESIDPVEFPASFIKDQKIHALIHCAQQLIYKLFADGKVYSMKAFRILSEDKRITSICGHLMGALQSSAKTNYALLQAAYFEDLNNSSIQNTDEQIIVELDKTDISFTNTIFIIPPYGGKTELAKMRKDVLIDLDEIIRSRDEKIPSSDTKMGTCALWEGNLARMYNNAKIKDVWKGKYDLLVSTFEVIPDERRNKYGNVVVCIPTKNLLGRIRNISKLADDRLEIYVEKLKNIAMDSEIKIIEYQSWRALSSRI